MSKEVSELYEVGPFRIDPVERLLLRHGKPIPLPHTVFELLLVLIRNNGHLVDKEAIIHKVWRDAAIEDGSLTVGMAKLRAALGDSAKNPRYIKTVPKHGYRFIAKVRRIPSQGLGLMVGEYPRAKTDAEPVPNPATSPVPPDPSGDSMVRPGAEGTSNKKLDAPGGALSLGSQFYIARPADEEFASAIRNQDS
ncbi:MAG: winged helix-turn-helix domain-containing protein, partial [Blastocatellia bacterium]